MAHAAASRAPLSPMLAVEAPAPFDDPDFLFEIKWDGYRALLEVPQPGTVRLWSRSGRDLAPQLPGLAQGLAEALPTPCLLDGEVVAVAGGRPDFVRLLRRQEPLLYVAFDLLAWRSESLLSMPLRERRARLCARVAPAPRLVLSEGVVGQGKTFFAAVTRLGLEGMMAKDLHSPYRPGTRSSAWRKVLNLQEGLFCVSQVEVDGWGRLQALWVSRQPGEEPVARLAGLPAALRRTLSPWAASLPGPGPRRAVPAGLWCRVRHRGLLPTGKLRHAVFVELVKGP